MYENAKHTNQEADAEIRAQSHLSSRSTDEDYFSYGRFYHNDGYLPDVLTKEAAVKQGYINWGTRVSSEDKLHCD